MLVHIQEIKKIYEYCHDFCKLISALELCRRMIFNSLQLYLTTVN